ncbi:uncharacterized protein [Venturia canescens]|uniref:uncharacterized protein isoform X2 n=1 Tax=Venturia canescens TaxID=32260 RepID=UPI001C9C3220|nr:uncharacterized protein LOC122408304 isoform X2 [Venturia canescens]
MGEIKAIFHFTSEAADSKTTIVKVKTIQLVGQPEIFQFPRELQTSDQHPQLFENAVTKGVVRSLKIRNKFRNVTITLTEGKLKEIYLDDEGNVAFNGYYLEEAQASAPISLQSSSIENQTHEKPIHSVAKNIILEKFNGKNFNAGAWMEMFVTECKRLDIRENRFSEVLRLFLEGPALEWFAIFLKTNSLSHAWEFWNNSFVDTFGQKAWSEIAYAYNFKYLNGSFLEFALKKRNMLLDVDPKLTISSQINLIVIMLPNVVRARLNKKSLTNMEDLMSTLRQIDPMKIKLNNNSNERNEDKHKTQNKYSPCSYCEGVGFPNRYHPEQLCRTKITHQKGNKNEKIKVANNIEIQDTIAYTEEAKNE